LKLGTGAATCSSVQQTLRKEVRVITRIKQAIKRVFKRNAKAH